jgi:ABC-type multidrug transport system ATPase subunit
MQIELKNLGKRYRYEWILKNMNFRFNQGEAYAVLGHNGSGKSTLMQILSGFLSPSTGKIIYTDKEKLIDINAIYRYVSFTAPYTELVEELTLKEAIAFHVKFKPLMHGMNSYEFLELLQLPKSAHDKSIQFFSSGMKQRLKLALSILSECPVLLLDEPSITLDREGVNWYKGLLRDYALGKKLLVIASNVEEDIQDCSQRLSIADFKVESRK